MLFADHWTPRHARHTSTHANSTRAHTHAHAHNAPRHTAPHQTNTQAKGGSFTGDDKDFLRFTLGKHEVIPAFEEAAAGMKVRAL
jgi:hypothetical protein